MYALRFFKLPASPMQHRLVVDSQCARWPCAEHPLLLLDHSGLLLVLSSGQDFCWTEALGCVLREVENLPASTAAMGHH
jgi:hypothetical protein